MCRAAVLLDRRGRNQSLGLERWLHMDTQSQYTRNDGTVKRASQACGRLSSGLWLSAWLQMCETIPHEAYQQ